MADLKNLRAMASPGARVYMDEVNSKACVDGTGPCDGILDAAAQAALKFNETADTAGNETADTAGDAVAEPAGP